MKLEEIEKLKLADHEDMFRERIAFSESKSLEDVTLDEIVEAFEQYKKELRDAENIRLAEEERLRTLQIRIDQLGKDHGELINEYLKDKVHNYGGYNSAAFNKYNIDKSDCNFWRYDIPKPTLEELETIRSVLESRKTAKDSEKKWKEFRNKRNEVLKSTDHTQLADCPITSEEKTLYREYRKYLRDLPTQYTQSTIDSAIIKSFDEYKESK